jgi:hypothetical protein
LNSNVTAIPPPVDITATFGANNSLSTISSVNESGESIAAVLVIVVVYSSPGANGIIVTMAESIR